MLHFCGEKMFMNYYPLPQSKFIESLSFNQTYQTLKIGHFQCQTATYQYVKTSMKNYCDLKQVSIVKDRVHYILWHRWAAGKKYMESILSNQHLLQIFETLQKDYTCIEVMHLQLWNFVKDFFTNSRLGNLVIFQNIFRRLYLFCIINSYIFTQTKINLLCFATPPFQTFLVIVCGMQISNVCEKNT